MPPSITLILSVILSGLGQHFVKLYATPCKTFAFKSVEIDHGRISNPPRTMRQIVSLILDVTSHFSSRLMGLRVDRRQGVHSPLVHATFEKE